MAIELIESLTSQVDFLRQTVKMRDEELAGYTEKYVVCDSPSGMAIAAQRFRRDE